MSVENSNSGSQALVLGDKFVFLVLLQVRPEVGKSIREALKKLISETPYIDSTLSGVYDIYGKHDILCVIYSDRLAETIDFFYNWIELTEGITDFARVAGFNWGNEFIKPDSLPSCITLIKLNYGKEYTALETELKVINYLKEKSKIEDNPPFKIEIDGTFGWYELFCTFYSESFYQISELIKNMRCDLSECIWETSTIPIRSTHCHDTKTNFKTLIYVEPGKENDAESWLRDNNWVLKDKFGVFDYLIEPVENVGIEKFEVQLEDFIDHCPGIRNVTTFLCFDDDEEHSSGFKSKQSIPLDLKKLLADYKQILNDRNSGQRNSDNIVDWKLKSLKSIVKMINRTPPYKAVLPPKLFSMIEQALDSSNDIEEKNWFLNHIRYLLQQRLSGSGISGILGKESGLFEQMGGYQRLILAAEAILYKAIQITETSKLNYYIGDKKIDKGGGFLHEGKPWCFLVFEYRPEFSIIKTAYKFPHAIHLPMTKYSPWNWIFIIHELGHAYHHLRESPLKYTPRTAACGLRSLLYYYKRLGISVDEWFNHISRIMEFYTGKQVKRELVIDYITERLSGFLESHSLDAQKKIDEEFKREIYLDIIIKNYPDDFFDYAMGLGFEIEADWYALNFIDKSIYFKTLLSYIGEGYFWRTIPKGQVTVTDKKFVSTISFLNRKFAFSQQENISNNEKEIMLMLERGEILSDIEDHETFISLINAYGRLPLEKQRSPRCLSAFVLSLFNSRMRFS